MMEQFSYESDTVSSFHFFSSSCRTTQLLFTFSFDYQQSLGTSGKIHKALRLIKESKRLKRIGVSWRIEEKFNERKHEIRIRI